MNKVIVIGHLGADPDKRYTPAGAVVSNFNIATNYRYKDAQGERQERTEWHRVVAWGKTADLCAEHLKKGRQVCIEGRLQTRNYEDDNFTNSEDQPVTRYVTEIVVEKVEFLGSAPKGNNQERGGGSEE